MQKLVRSSPRGLFLFSSSSLSLKTAYSSCFLVLSRLKQKLVKVNEQDVRGAILVTVLLFEQQKCFFILNSGWDFTNTEHITRGYLLWDRIIQEGRRWREDKGERKRQKVVHNGTFWFHNLISIVYPEPVRSYIATVSPASRCPFRFIVPVKAASKPHIFTDTN